MKTGSSACRLGLTCLTWSQFWGSEPLGNLTRKMEVYVTEPGNSAMLPKASGLRSPGLDLGESIILTDLYRAMWGCHSHHNLKFQIHWRRQRAGCSDPDASWGTDHSQPRLRSRSPLDREEHSLGMYQQIKNDLDGRGSDWKHSGKEKSTEEAWVSFPFNK